MLFFLYQSKETEMSKKLITIGKIQVNTIPSDAIKSLDVSLIVLSKVSVNIDGTDIPVMVPFDDIDSAEVKQAAWERELLNATSDKTYVCKVEIDHRYHRNTDKFFEHLGQLLTKLITSPAFQRTKIDNCLQVVFSYFDMTQMEMMNKLKSQLETIVPSGCFIKIKVHPLHV